MVFCLPHFILEGFYPFFKNEVHQKFVGYCCHGNEEKAWIFTLVAFQKYRMFNAIYLKLATTSGKMKTALLLWVIYILYL